MSILRFLRVIQQEIGAAQSGKSRQKSRPLSLEPLEGRAVLTLLGELPLTLPPLSPPPIYVPLPPLFEPAPTDSAPPLEYPPPPDDPVTPPPVDSGETNPDPGEPPPEEGDPGGGLPADPIDVGQDFNSPPVLTASAESSDGWVTISGSVTDDKSLVGIVIFCHTDTGLAFTLTLGSDGHFQSEMLFVTPGSMITLWAVDTDGLYSNTVMCMA